MSAEFRKLLTIVTEASLERTLIKEFAAWGVNGYTISDARGKGSRGMRDADWDVAANIRVEIVCTDAMAHSVLEQLQKKYYQHFAMIAFISEVEVLRPEKF